MYFANEEHKYNFDNLVEMYTQQRSSKIASNVQYLANIYIAAYPDIFDCLNLKQLNTGAGPLFDLVEWDEEKEMDVVSAAGLTGSTTRLTQVGLSLYNGYPIGLDDVFGSLTSQELFDVFIQACRIRASK